MQKTRRCSANAKRERLREGEGEREGDGAGGRGGCGASRHTNEVVDHGLERGSMG